MINEKLHGTIRKLKNKENLKFEKNITEEDIIGLIKDELPYDSVEIKKRGSKGLKW